MTKKELAKKIEKVEALFDEIKSIFPESHMDMNIFDIDVVNLPKKWRVEREIKDNGDIYFTAKRNDEVFDITLFS